MNKYENNNFLILQTTAKQHTYSKKFDVQQLFYSSVYKLSGFWAFSGNLNEEFQFDTMSNQENKTLT